MRTGSPRSISSWFRRSHFGCSTDCWLSDTTGGELCGLASPRIRPPNGSLGRSAKRAAGIQRLLIWFVIGTASMASVKDAPIPTAVQDVGRILPMWVLNGLHHHYVRI